MNLRKKIGQLLVVGFLGEKVNEEIRTLIHEFHIGAVILFSRNLGSPEQVLKLTTDLQKEAKKAGYTHPLLITIDQENGIVQRLTEGVTTVPGAMLIGATQKPEAAFKAAYVTAKELKVLGINWNLAPVVDVNNNAENPVIGVRSYGEDPQQVAAFAKEAMRGMQKANVITTLKHFPGHGDTNTDSHLDLPVIQHDLKRLNEVELVPFKACIAAGADIVMSAHVYFPALEANENMPATLSKHVITGLLREELQFDGVITTDCMEMDAIANGIGTVEGCIRAIEAGVDFVMVSHKFPLQKQTILAVEEAIQQGRLSEKRIDESINRINKLREHYISWDDVLFDFNVPSFVGGREHQAEMKAIFDSGITVVKGHGALNKAVKTLIISPITDNITLVEDQKGTELNIAKCFSRIEMELDEISYKLNESIESIEQIVQIAKEYEQIIVFTINIARYYEQKVLIEKLQQLNIKLHFIAARSPYDISFVTKAETIICTYELTKPVIESLCAYLMDGYALNGSLPVMRKDENYF